MSNDPEMKRKAISELRAGDLVDLENDKFADNGNHPEFEFELQEVESIEVESPECIAVYFVNVPCIGFPPDHTIPVQACPTLQIAEPRPFSPIEMELAASLACYCSGDDYGIPRRDFLISVRDRIDMDLTTGEF